MDDKELKYRVKAIFQSTREKCIATCLHYGGSKEILDVRLLEKLDHILDSEDLNQAGELAKRAEDSVFMFCLSMWGKGKIRGPNTVELWEGKAAKAESLARYFEKQSQDKHVICEPGAKEKCLAKAEKQRYRAGKLREYAAALTKDPRAPQPSFSMEEEEVPAEVPAPMKKGRVKAAPPPPAPAPVGRMKPKGKKVVGLAPNKRRKSA